MVHGSPSWARTGFIFPPCSIILAISLLVEMMEVAGKPPTSLMFLLVWLAPHVSSIFPWFIRAVRFSLIVFTLFPLVWRSCPLRAVFWGWQWSGRRWVRLIAIVAALALGVRQCSWGSRGQIRILLEYLSDKLLFCSVGSDKLDKQWLDNRANFSIINNRPLITIIIELRPWQYYRATTGLLQGQYAIFIGLIPPFLYYSRIPI